MDGIMEIMCSIISLLCVGSSVLVFVYLCRTYYRYGLNQYPGPWLASISPLWYRRKIATNSEQQALKDLHRRYGPVVRITPDMVSLSDPKYLVHHSLLEDQYKKKDKVVAAAPDECSPQLAADIEKHIDVVIAKLIRTIMLDDSGSGPLRLEDLRFEGLVDDFIRDVILQVILGDNIGVLWAGSSGSKMNLRTFITFKTLEHVNRWESKRSTVIDRPLDIMDLSFKDLTTKHETITGSDIFSITEWTLDSFKTGSHMITYMLNKICHHLSKNQEAFLKLKKEITESKLSCPASCKEVQLLTYLNAFFKEILYSIRRQRHSPLYDVPVDGFVLLDGRVVPKGVKINLSAIDQSQSCYPDLCHQLKPEGWSQDLPEVTPTNWDRTRIEIEQNKFPLFGGTSTFYGESLTTMIILKLLATLLPHVVPWTFPEESQNTLSSSSK